MEGKTEVAFHMPENLNQPVSKGKKVKFYWQMILIILLLAMIIAFAAINTQKVNVNLIFGRIDVPMILLILCSFVLGVVLTLITVWFRRRSKSRKQAG